MKLSPLDIRKHEFSKKLRGYDPDEVRPFLDMLSQQWEEIQEELRYSRDRVREYEMKIAHYEKVEVALQEALEAAKASAERTQAHAEERARLILEDAELKAEQKLHEVEHERYRLRQDVSKLTHRHAEITARLRHFLMSELEILAQHEEERPIGFMKLIPAREAEALPDADDEGETRWEESGSGSERGRESARDQGEGGGEEAGTTYADLYARASQRASDQHQSRAGEPEHVEPPETEEEPAWTLRSLIDDEGEGKSDRPDKAPRSEKDHIRRILEDLD